MFIQTTREIRLATMEDADILLEIKNDEDVRMNSIVTQEKIKKENHLVWLFEHLASPKTQLYVILDNGTIAGDIRFDIEEKIEVSTRILKEHRKKGLASWALRVGCKMMRERSDKKMFAKIVDGNYPSMQLYLKNGFEVVNHFKGNPSYFVLEKSTVYKNPNIEGWMSEEELQWLYSNATKMDSIVEVGSWKGRSTHALLTAGAEVYAIDHFKGNEGYPSLQAEALNDNIYNQFLKNVGQFKNLTILKMPSLEAVKNFKDREVDMVFLDGSHKYEDVKLEIKEWMPKASKLICGHDYDWDEVADAVSDTFENFKVRGSIWYKFL